MQRHAKDVHRLEEKGHKCPKCFKSFPTSQQLAQHSLVHTNIRKYQCQYCEKAFKQLSHVQQHQRIHTGERPYKCTVESCGKAFAQLSNLQQHLKNHDVRMSQADKKPYNCNICDRRFATEASLNHHVTKVHNLVLSCTPPPLLPIKVEPASAASQEEPKSPISTNQQEHRAPNLCTSIYGSLADTPSNSGVTDLRLPREHKEVAQQSLKDLTAKLSEISRRDLNLLRLSTERLYSFPSQLHSSLARPHDLTCQVCEKQCSDEERFFKHIHKYHADYWRVFSGGRPLTDFIGHREVKRREKRYSCPVCNKQYSHETGYVKHLATHPGGDPALKLHLFACTVCQKMFTKESYLLRHMEMKLDDDHNRALTEYKLKFSTSAHGMPPHALSRSDSDHRLSPEHPITIKSEYSDGLGLGERSPPGVVGPSTSKPYDMSVRAGEPVSTPHPDSHDLSDLRFSPLRNERGESRGPRSPRERGVGERGAAEGGIGERAQPMVSAQHSPISPRESISSSPDTPHITSHHTSSNALPPNSQLPSSGSLGHHMSGSQSSGLPPVTQHTGGTPHPSYPRVENPRPQFSRSNSDDPAAFVHYTQNEVPQDNRNLHYGGHRSPEPHPFPPRSPEPHPHYNPHFIPNTQSALSSHSVPHSVLPRPSYLHSHVSSSYSLPPEHFQTPYLRGGDMSEHEVALSLQHLARSATNFK